MNRFTNYLAAAAAIGGMSAPLAAQQPYPYGYPQQPYPQQAIRQQAAIPATASPATTRATLATR